MVINTIIIIIIIIFISIIILTVMIIIMIIMIIIIIITEPVLQEITGEELNRGANKAPDARSRVLGQTAICVLRCSGVPSKRRFVSTTVSETDIPTT